jgi:hypothetical protein
LLIRMCLNRDYCSKPGAAPDQRLPSFDAKLFSCVFWRRPEYRQEPRKARSSFYKGHSQRTTSWSTFIRGMQTWLWGEMFPNDMDCLVAIASTPAAISGRNTIWREMISQAIRSDPAWKNGDYPTDSPPKNWIKTVIPLSAIMTGSAGQLQKQAPTRETAIASSTSWGLTAKPMTRTTCSMPSRARLTMIRCQS